MSTIIFWIIIFIIAFDYLSDQFLSFLNNRARKKALPETVEGIYDKSSYERWQLYETDKFRFSIVSSTFSLVLLLLFIFLSGFPFVDAIVRSITTDEILMALLFFGIIGFLSSLIGIPFSWYHTFVLEERHGFNKTTPKTFITDIIKSWFLTLLIGAPLIAFVVWVFVDSALYMWIVAWVVVSLFLIFINFFYSTLIVPIFNKQTPLQEGALRDAIEKFAAKVGFKLSGIFVIDGSKRSAKANAYFAGFGKKKRIVLYDTLIEQLSEDELVAVLAHEIGHYKKQHVIKNIVLSVINMGVMFYLLSLFISKPEFSTALGVEVPAFHVSIITFGILYGFISTFTGIFLNMYSRRNEYEADKYAAQNYSSSSLENALKKLSITNLSNLQPHPWFVFVYYSHPPLIDRIRYLREI